MVYRCGGYLKEDVNLVARFPWHMPVSVLEDGPSHPYICPFQKIFKGPLWFVYGLDAEIIIFSKLIMTIMHLKTLLDNFNYEVINYQLSGLTSLINDWMNLHFLKLNPDKRQTSVEKWIFALLKNFTSKATWVSLR